MRKRKYSQGKQTIYGCVINCEYLVLKGKYLNQANNASSVNFDISSCIIRLWYDFYVKWQKIKCVVLRWVYIRWDMYSAKNIFISWFVFWILLGWVCVPSKFCNWFLLHCVNDIQGIEECYSSQVCYHRGKQMDELRWNAYKNS